MFGADEMSDFSNADTALSDLPWVCPAAACLDERLSAYGRQAAEPERLRVGLCRRKRLRTLVLFPRLGCRQLRSRDTQQLAQPISIFPSISLD